MYSPLPLSMSETTKLAASIANYQLDEMETQRLFKETEGNPLFVEEIVRAGIGSFLISQSTPIIGLDHRSLRLPRAYMP